MCFMGPWLGDVVPLIWGAKLLMMASCSISSMPPNKCNWSLNVQDENWGGFHWENIGTSSKSASHKCLKYCRIWFSLLSRSWNTTFWRVFSCLGLHYDKFQWISIWNDLCDCDPVIYLISGLVGGNAKYNVKQCSYWEFHLICFEPVLKI